MYRLIIFVFLLSVCQSCHEANKPVVDVAFIDSLLLRPRPSAFEKMLSADSLFWTKRLAETPDSYTASTRRAGILVQRFHFYGDITDLLTADSILRSLSIAYKEREAGIFRSLASLNISMHRFKDADGYVGKALNLGGEKYASTLLYFDTQFELGHYTMAEQALRQCASTNEYGYFFRLSKWKHLKGETDSAVYYMQKAAGWAGNSVLLQQAALSNMADLLMHEGKLEKANELYVSCVKQNPSDYHSLRGIGRIALMKDRNIAAAEKLFRFIASKNKLPDPLFDMVWVGEQQTDPDLQIKYARAFAEKASDSMYGNMYNKYLIDLYTGPLKSPAKALEIAEKEMGNRATPQTYAWLVWCLHRSGDDTRALEIYNAHVSGKPLEALELYWMGKMMKDMGKSFNATEYFKAAELNIYDLSPSKQKDLISSL